jgi:hypothetical protein
MKRSRDPLPTPVCESGYTTSQLIDILGDRYEDFGLWMSGQTITICEGRAYNHDTREYREKCGGVSHGLVVYPWDLERFL